MSIAAFLDHSSPSDAEAALTRCCGSTAWVRAMLARLPFGDDAAVLAAGDEIWKSLSAGDWHEAFAQHPRIGARRLDAAPDERASEWSRKEQGTMATASQTVRDALVAGNEAYEERFGHVFLICATGLEPEAMLAALEERLHNDPEAELAIAAAEQAKITRLRLGKLVSE